MPLTIGTIASCYVFGAPTLVASPIVSFMGDVTTSVYLSTTTGTWSVPIINTTYEWLSSTDNSTWFTTNITQLSSSFFGLDNTYLKTIVRGVDINLTPVSATSLSIYTSGMSFKSVVLQLNGDTIIPVLKDTFIDSSSNNFIITKSGTPTQGTFSPFSYTLSSSGVVYNPAVHGGSGYFNGSTSTLTTPNFTWSSGDFTIETWVNFNNINNVYGKNSPNNQYIFDTGSGNMTRLQIIGGVLRFYINGTMLIYYVLNPAVSVWYHIAVSRQSNTIKMFVNGVSVGTPATSSATPSAGIIRIGNTSWSSGAYNAFLNGYLSDFRIINGTALYTSNFAKPTAPLTIVTGTSLLLNFTNGGVIDSSGRNNLVTIGAPIQGTVNPYGLVSLRNVAYDPSVYGGSVYLNGVNDAFTISNTTPFNFGTGDFTIECWINLSTVPNSANGKIILDSRPDNTNGAYWILGIPNTGGKISFNCGNVSQVHLISTTSLVSKRWYHVAITRSGTILKMFVNGVEESSITNNLSVGAGQLLVGCNAFRSTAPDTWFDGFISDIRILKGTARVITNNPSTPLTSVTNTSLLLSFTNSSVLDITSRNNISINGNAGVSNNVKKFGVGALSFDGTGDYLSVPVNPDLTFGTGDFTIECWVYCTNLNGGGSKGQGGIMELVEYRYTINSEVKTTLAIVANSFVYWVNGSMRIQSGTILAGTWYHVAVARSNGITKMFVDGSQVGINYIDLNNYLISSPAIGATANGSYAFSGYIDDLRITKAARYTGSTFTLPTTAYPVK